MLLQAALFAEHRHPLPVSSQGAPALWAAAPTTPVTRLRHGPTTSARSASRSVIIAPFPSASLRRPFPLTQRCAHPRSARSLPQGVLSTFPFPRTSSRLRLGSIHLIERRGIAAAGHRREEIR